MKTVYCPPRMLEMWTNFVKYLDPTPGLGGPGLGATKWEQVSRW